MSLFFYNIFCVFYKLGIRLASPFNSKAGKWIEGRKDWEQKINKAPLAGGKKIWIHCASLGEFEQGRPLIEAIRRKYKGAKIVLTFFSPSGYEIRKDYDQADLVMYMPMDGKRTAEKFLSLVKPDLAIFVKYEFWFHYLDQLKKKQVPTLLVSAAFRQEQPFFKGRGGLFRKMLDCFTAIFVQDELSAGLLAGLGMSDRVAISGDTRYDRVNDIARSIRPLAIAETFKGNSQILIAGSTWPADEQLLKACIDHVPAGWKIILAPHEIHDAHIKQISELFGHESILYSEMAAGKSAQGKRILVVDNMGMLSSLYAYGELAYIGGGFAKGGIHNVLEPAVFGLPVLIGPEYRKFVEAVALVDAGYVFPVADADSCGIMLQHLIKDDTYRQELGDGLKKFMKEHTGATDTILNYIVTQRWLA